VIDRINAAVEKGNGLELKKLITIDTLNLELKVRSYEVKHKKNLSLQYIADSWKNDGVLFEVSEVDIDAQTAQMKLAAGDDVIYEGKVDFVTEVGQLKLDFTEILKAKLAELEESQGSKGKKKKKGK
jgi:homogentisate 1,2-dioxygenase